MYVYLKSTSVKNKITMLFIYEKGFDQFFKNLNFYVGRSEQFERIYLQNNNLSKFHLKFGK